MSREGTIQLEGEVIAALPNSRFTIKLNNGHFITGYTGGKIKQDRIRILCGDIVTVELTKFDLKNGRITRRKSASQV